MIYATTTYPYHSGSCNKACGGFTCPSNFVSKPDSTNVVGNNRAICCDETCAGFTCRAGYAAKAGSAANIVGHGPSDCCDEACSGFTCDAGYISKPEASMIAGNDQIPCCSES